MASQNINVGTNADDGTGESLRSAFIDIRKMFAEVYGQTYTSDTQDLGGATLAIKENQLSVTNSPTDGYVLTYDNASGGFTWEQKFDGDITGIVAGDGLTGDATSGDATLAVGGGTGITVSADSIATNDSEIVHDNLSGFVSNEHIDHSTVSITAGSGLTGGGDLTATRDLAVNVDDSTIEIATDTLQVKDDGISYAKMAAEFTTASTISASDVDFSSAAVFTKTLSANTTLTFSNVSTGMVKDLVITGNYTLALPASVKTITGTYDGTVSNLIQIVSTNGSTEQWATISQEA